MDDHEHNLTKSQLFLDDTWIEEQSMLTRIWHKPHLFPEPVMRPEMPWEGTNLAFYGTVFKIGEAWRMYYTTASPDFRAAMCVADSTDGFHWTRPELGIHEFRGSKKNNIAITHCRCVSVYHDPEDEYPFRTMVHRGPSKTGHPVYGMYEAVSKDGYHWTELDVVVPYPPSEAVHDYQDGREGTRALAGSDVYYLWARKVNGEFVVTYKEDQSLARRSVGMSRGPDFKSFSDTRIILRSDLLDPPDVQYHGMVGFPYGDMYLGLAERWFGAPTHFEIMLVWSHDLETWHMPPNRQAFIGPTLPWNAAWTTCSTGGPVQSGNQLRIYFGGQSGSHIHVKKGPHKVGNIGLAEITVDRFASVSAGYMDGRLVTKPMQWPGGDLMVNASTSRELDADPRLAGGQMLIEVFDADGQPVAGFSGDQRASFEGNHPARGDTDAAAIRWPGDRSMREHAGRGIRLVFHLRDAHLYSFRSSDAKEG